MKRSQNLGLIFTKCKTFKKSVTLGDHALYSHGCVTLLGARNERDRDIKILFCAGRDEAGTKIEKINMSRPFYIPTLGLHSRYSDIVTCNLHSVHSVVLFGRHDRRCCSSCC